jgi:hypothetical protein
VRPNPPEGLSELLAIDAFTCGNVWNGHCGYGEQNDTIMQDLIVFDVPVRNNSGLNPEARSRTT